jgi:hypothetical protein
MTKILASNDVKGNQDETISAVIELTRVSPEEMVKRVIAASDEELFRIQIATIDLQGMATDAIQQSLEEIVGYRALARTTLAVQLDRTAKAAKSGHS